jgi:cytidine deaminase
MNNNLKFPSTWTLSLAHAMAVANGKSSRSQSRRLQVSAAHMYMKWLHERIPLPNDTTPAAVNAEHAAIFASAVRRAGTLRARAQAPYSHFPVGAALLCADGTIIDGVNVESSSYGGTICAERSALVSALSQGYKNFAMIAIRANTETPISPCGSCRQLLYDYAPDLLVVMLSQDGSSHMAYIRELLPLAFGATDLATNPATAATAKKTSR